MVDYRSEYLPQKQEKQEKKVNPYLSQIVDKKSLVDSRAFPGKYRSFVLSEPNPTPHIIAEYWLNSGTFYDTGKPKTFPLISPFVGNARRAEKKFRKTGKPTGEHYYPIHFPDCPLAKLAKAGHKIIALTGNNKFPPSVTTPPQKTDNKESKPTEGTPRPNADLFYCFKAWEVEYNWVKVNQVWEPAKDSTGKVIFKVNPKEVVLKMSSSIFTQLVEKILQPSEIVGDSEIKPLPKVPTNQVVIKLIKEKDGTKNNPDDKMNVKYTVGYSASFVVTPDKLPNPIEKLPDFSEIFPTTSEEEVNEAVTRFEILSSDIQATGGDKPGDYEGGETVPPAEGDKDSIPF